MVPLAKLTPLADNPRSHTTRGIDFIASSLDRVGAARSGVIDEKRVILAGNGMRQAAVQAGYRDAIVVRVDGTRPVFVQRANLSPPQKSRVIIDDNRASELSGWNARLLDYAERDLSIQAEWTAPEWRAAVGPRPVTEGRTDPDATVAHRPTTIVRGDQFRLGSHSLRCGDSTDSADVQALLGDRKSQATNESGTNDSSRRICVGFASGAARRGQSHGRDTHVEWSRSSFRQMDSATGSAVR